MGSKEGSKCYIVKDNVRAKRVNKKEGILRLGTLVYVKYAISDKLVMVKINTSEKFFSTYDETLWECPIDLILPFDECMKPYIVAISSPKDRIKLVENGDLCRKLISISVGNRVQVISQKSSCDVEPVREALVKYKGSVHQLGVGIYFGLELLDSDPFDKETCDGSYPGGSRYFQAPQGRGIFVTINEIRPHTAVPPVFRDSKPICKPVIKFDGYLIAEEVNVDESDKNKPYQACAVKQVREKFESMSRNSHLTSHSEKLIDLSPNQSSATIEDIPLKVGERVVWIRDSGQEYGVVRWLGRPDPHNPDDVKAGVEFEGPVGNLAGCHKGRHNFEAKKNHQVLPVMALVKADDLYEHIPTSDLLTNKKKPLLSPSASTSASLDDTCCRKVAPAALKHGGALKPDQLYVSTRNKLQDSKWSCGVDELEDRLCSNGSMTSPLETKNFVNCKRDKKMDNGSVESDLNCYGVSHSNHSINSKQNDKCITKGCEPNNHDNITMKSKINTRSAKVNNVDCDSTNPNQQWSSRSKQDCDFKGDMGYNGKCVKVNNLVDRSPGYSHYNPDIDPDILPSRSPSEHSIGGSDGYYDTPDSLHDLRDLRDSPEPPIMPHPDLGVGSVVEVTVKGESLYGVIRWIGNLPDDKKTRKVAGIEMEEERAGLSDGTFHGHRYFLCNPRKALFVNLKWCQKDGRFQEPPAGACADPKSKAFGQVDCPIIKGIVRPVAVSGDLQSKCGKFHGIQGHHNSCYLDATLFSMFTFTSVFDSLLYRPPTEKDCVQYEEVQRVLREEIVNPLRENLFVRADRVMKLRTLLENHTSVTGLTSEEKDPEEFLNSLVAQILQAEPFLKLSSGQEAYHYQLFVEKDEQLKLPSVQKLFEQSFLASDIKLKEVPSCLIIQMPRFGKSFKMYPRILPTQLLDVTDVIEDSPRQCMVCGKLAYYECKECMDTPAVDLENIAYCAQCLKTVHSHQSRVNHVWRRLKVPDEFTCLEKACTTIPRLYMELFAVVCIETSHYVAFVKCGSGSDAPWCFFDSMADRKGEQNGYNIPEMVPCPDLPYWLSEKGAQSLMDVRDNRQLPEHAKRLLCDAYMCMYQSSDVMMYR